MTKKNVSLYFAEHISRPFDPKEYIKEKHNLNFKCNGNIYYCIESYSPSISWSDFFKQITNHDLPCKTIQKYYAIVFFLTSSNNMFAIPFGTGNNKLNKSKFVYNFGLKTSLNMLNLDGYVYQYSSKSISEIKMRKDMTSSSALQISQLDFNQLTDVLNAINGDLADEYQKKFGCKKIQGSQALNISLDAENLTQQLESIEKAFRLNNYQDKFKFIDNISPLLRNETELKQALDSHIISDIKNNNFGLFAPLDSTQYYSISSIKYKEQDITNFSIEDFKKIISDKKVDDKNLVRFLKNQEVNICLQNFDGSEFTVKKKFYDFISLDVTTEDGKFLLEQGMWFRCAPNLTDTLDNFFKDRLISRPYEFINVTIDSIDKKGNKNWQREEDYLRKISQKNPSFILGDQKLIDQTEVFDLFNNNILYHIKKGTSGSAPLSHLFAQGLVSIERIKGEDEFLKETRKKFPKISIDISNLRLRFGIIKNSETIPIFSKITFKSNADAIEKRIDKKVELFFIPRDE